MSSNLQSDTFSVIKNPKAFGSLYNFQLDLDKNYKKKIFVDSSDYVSLIVGSHNYYDITNNDYYFRFSHFSQKMTILHALIYNQYLGAVRLLNPHMFEFMEKTNPSEPKMLNSLKLEQSDEIVDRLSLINPPPEEIANRPLEEILPFEKVEQEAESRFKLMYLIDREHPKKRATYLIENKIISFEVDKAFSIPDIVTTALFKKLYAALNRIEKKKNQNNFYDALALYQLQQKLVKAQKQISKEQKNVEIPLFYGRGKILTAVEEIANEPSLKVNGIPPFTFSGESGFHSIVQNEDFFIIDALYKFKSDEKPLTFEDFFQEINNFYSSTIKLADSTNSQAMKQLSPNSSLIKKAVHLDFFKKWWEKGKGEMDLKKSLKILHGFEQEELDVQELEYISDEFEKTYQNAELQIREQNLGLKYAKIAFQKKFAESLSEKFSRGKLLYDLDQEFLTRFSYPTDSVKAIKSFIYRLYDSYQGDTNSTNDAKMDMIAYLQFVLNYDILRIDRNEDKKDKLEYLCAMLSILWIEEEYELIHQFCMEITNTFIANSITKEIDNYYPNYQIAFLHASSILRINNLNNSEYSKIDRILNCVHVKYGEKTYKVWLGEAFVYSKLWESVSRKVSIPEINNITKPLSDNQVVKRKEYYKKCSELSLKSYDKIKELQKDLPEKRERNRREFYALNVYIYIEILNRKIEKFPGDLDQKVKELEAVSEDYLNHERYLDTLARYDQRMAAKIAISDKPDKAKFELRVANALRRINSAIELASSNKNSTDMNLFNSLKDELERMNIDGLDYFNDKGEK